MKKSMLIIVLATTLLFLNACTNKQYEEPTQLINNDLAKDLSARYSERRSGLILADIGKEDASAVWYSIEELENYINYVKREGTEKGIDVNGIRFYMGVYPDDSTVYKEKAGLTTIFLAPTKKRDTLFNKTKKVARTAQSMEEKNIDVTEIQPLNYGGIGHPPKVSYPQE